MTITLQPQQEQAVQAAIDAGLVRSVEELIDSALERLPQPPAPEAVPPAKNLVELFENSPFKGLDIEFERDRDYGREIEL